MTSMTQRFVAIGVVVLLLLAGFAAGVSADRLFFSNRPPPPPGPDRAIERFQQELGLSADQSAHVKTALREGHEASRQALEAARAKVRAVLTAEQQSKFDELTKRMPGPPGAGGPPPFGDRPPPPPGFGDRPPPPPPPFGDRPPPPPGE